MSAACDSRRLTPGAAGITNHESTSKEVPFNVRTPANYDPTIAHPLLVVYAAAGNNRYETEGLTGLTTEAARWWATCNRCEWTMWGYRGAVSI